MALDSLDNPIAPAVQASDIADLIAQNQDARQREIAQLRIVRKLAVHSSRCRSAQCLYPNCRKGKRLFIHGSQCQVRVDGGCDLCRTLWMLLHIHAVACEKAACHLPRCRDLQEHMRGQRQLLDLPTGAADMVMRRLNI